MTHRRSRLFPQADSFVVTKNAFDFCRIIRKQSCSAPLLDLSLPSPPLVPLCPHEGRVWLGRARVQAPIVTGSRLLGLLHNARARPLCTRGMSRALTQHTRVDGRSQLRPAAARVSVAVTPITPSPEPGVHVRLVRLLLLHQRRRTGESWKRDMDPACDPTALDRA
jgi:hypothetical protein